MGFVKGLTPALRSFVMREKAKKFVEAVHRLVNFFFGTWYGTEHQNELRKYTPVARIHQAADIGLYAEDGENCKFIDIRVPILACSCIYFSSFQGILL